MKTLVYLLFSGMLIFSTAYAEELDKNINTICPGTWVLQYYGAWSVHNNDGTTLPLSSESIFYDCQKNELSPSQDFAGREVEIECLLANEQNNLPNVTKVFFICK